jgi:broad specificity phosphatase PhoE
VISKENATGFSHNPDITFTLLRHGLSTANIKGIAQGQSDYPLHERGVDQAESLAAYWKKSDEVFDIIVSSPLKRALDTAWIIANTQGLYVQEEPLWMERDFGEGEGLSYEEIEKQLTSKASSWSNSRPFFKNSESEHELIERASKAISNAMRLKKKKILIVSHGGILNAALRYVLRISLEDETIRPPGFQYSNTGFSKLIFQPSLSRWRIIFHNATPHLETTI